MHKAILIGFSLVALLSGQHVPPGTVAATSDKREAPDLDGLWDGAWGGGERDGVIFQPVLAELFIKDDHIEWVGFRASANLTGTVRVDAGARKLHVRPASEPGKPAPTPVVFTYELKGDTLTLIDGDKVALNLKRLRFPAKPLANVTVELVETTGMNDAGDLLVTEYTELRVGRVSSTLYQPQQQALKTRHAKVLIVEETGCKEISLPEARKRLRPSTVVAVTYRREGGPAPGAWRQLSKDLGAPIPSSEAVWQTFSRSFRPGTLVFVLSPSENVPRP
jgi:hypothetical protein